MTNKICDICKKVLDEKYIFQDDEGVFRLACSGVITELEEDE